jgi:hypothetical protein
MHGEDTFNLLVGLAQFVCCFVVGLLFLRSIQRSRRRKAQLREGRTLDEIARLMNGEVDRTAEFPFVRFHRQGARCYFVQWGIGSADVVVSTLEACAGTPGFLEASSADSRRMLSRFPRARETPTYGSFRIVTTDFAWAHGLLRTGLGPLLREFHAWAGAPVRVQMTPGRLTVEVEAITGTAESVHLTRFFDRLFELVHGSDEPDGVTVLSTSFDPSRGRCPVCGMLTTAPLTLCAGCRAPHHADCWAYAGRCGIFGCGARRSA